jgi:glyoxylase-like metal-dependent hydrolase (beta-lactamase superfamily II)
MRKLWSILGNSQRLDGGAMFGNAPKPMWEKWIAPDELNRIPLACRTMLIEEEGGRRILFETGIGAFFPPKLRERFGVQESEHMLLKGLHAIGLSDADIDVVVLSHLHFDHSGGLLAAYREGTQAQLLFPKASFVVGDEAWQRAVDPHPRDRASFIEELQPMLEASGRLELVRGERSDVLGPDYRMHRSHGHTPGLMLSEVPSESGPIVFAADLIPGRPWVHLPITMGYDRFPEQLIDEKRSLLSDLVSRNGRLFFTHDPEVALSRVARDEKGKFSAGESWPAPVALPI